MDTVTKLTKLGFITAFTAQALITFLSFVTAKTAQSINCTYISSHSKKILTQCEI